MEVCSTFCKKGSSKFCKLSNCQARGISIILWLAICHFLPTFCYYNAVRPYTPLARANKISDPRCLQPLRPSTWSTIRGFRKSTQHKLKSHRTKRVAVRIQKVLEFNRFCAIIIFSGIRLFLFR